MHKMAAKQQTLISSWNSMLWKEKNYTNPKNVLNDAIQTMD